MKTILHYLAGVVLGIGIGVLGSYYLGLAYKYVPGNALLTTLVTVLGGNFVVFGVLLGYWAARKSE